MDYFYWESFRTSDQPKLKVHDTACNILCLHKPLWDHEWVSISTGDEWKDNAGWFLATEEKKV